VIRLLFPSISFGLGLVACASGGLPQPTAAHLSVAQSSDPQVTLDDLSRGRSLYGARCGGCHQLPDPARPPSAGWQREIDEMKDKQGVRLSGADSHDILRYLDAVSSVASR
jgi:mono/diheme cytochrome c family protein